MRLKRFNESVVEEIPFDKTQDIISGLKQTLDNFSDKLFLIDSINNQLDNYKSGSDTPTDQIDDSIFNIQVVKKNLETSIDKIKNTIGELNDYLDNGRRKID